MNTVTPPADVRAVGPAAGWRATVDDGRVDAPPGIFPPPADLELLCRIHQGEFSEIWQARDRSTRELVAWKQWRPDASQPAVARMRLANEAVVLGRISSPRVISLRGTDLDAPWPALRLKWLAGQSLRSLLKTQSRLTTRATLWIARQCAQGFADLQTAGFLHCAVSARHVFIQNDGTVTLIDLGTAQRDATASLDLASAMEVPSRTGRSSNRFERRVENDIAALAGLMIEMLSGRSIDQLMESENDHARRPASITQRLRGAVPDLPREVADLIQRMLTEPAHPRGDGVTWLIHALVGLELAELATACDTRDGGEWPL